MRFFFEKKLEKFSDNRNDPNLEVVSNLSPYLHFGQLSAATIALAAKKGVKNLTTIEKQKKCNFVFSK